MRRTLVLMPYFFVVTLIIGPANGHFSFVHKPSQIACDFAATDGIDWLSKPLVEDDPFEDWWFHGQVNCQSKATKSFELPAGGEIDIVMSSRVNLVPPPWGIGNDFVPSADEVISAQQWGYGAYSNGNKLGGRHNIHAYSRDDTSGCALAIAYKSKATEVTEKDFVVFSVMHDCPKRLRETMKVPNLPVCPNGNCICAWFWIPKNSGSKNFYMTPFVCRVTGANHNASPVDVGYAIPPRRCLDPINCGGNFGPRRPMYWLGSGELINMPEGNTQSPNYSIRYGFRDGAQHDIFVSTNPRRNAIQHTNPGFPPEEKCSQGNYPSRLMSTKSFFSLKSPSCGCSAELLLGTLTVMNGSNVMWTHRVSTFGPNIVTSKDEYKATASYFPRRQGPYKIDLNDKCYLYLTDSMGVVLWESEFNANMALDHVVHSFRGYDNDPIEWSRFQSIKLTNSPTKAPAKAPTKSPTKATTTHKEEEESSNDYAFEINSKPGSIATVSDMIVPSALIEKGGLCPIDESGCKQPGTYEPVTFQCNACQSGYCGYSPKSDQWKCRVDGWPKLDSNIIETVPIGSIEKGGECPIDQNECHHPGTLQKVKFKCNACQSGFCGYSKQNDSWKCRLACWPKCNLDNISNDSEVVVATTSVVMDKNLIGKGETCPIGRSGCELLLDAFEDKSIIQCNACEDGVCGYMKRSDSW
eukprot:CAMPEP_0194360102 /NCGR_PEP_ID=MMETSP0174-20130528/7397_1 /TAXON_ID=216777 /ORGANISM="Proboscia alata, Strain PI-D3" /LENGTH=693 /DNA_ID=CAMNT_0039131389 /DNA_START=19 /DNA_END=2097 /DNA_ORIENTATION=-